MTVDPADEPVAAPEPVDERAAAAAAAVAEGWRTDKQGRSYVSAVGRRGVLYRRGQETVAEALARDARPKDEMPRERKRVKAPIPDRPSDTELRALEVAITEALRSPAMLAAYAGDEYLANHFTRQAPMLARNLVVCSEHNPWLRRRLERMTQGGDAAMALITMLGLGGALLAYAGPPVVYVFNLGVPDRARAMFDIPPRRVRDSEVVNGAPAPVPAAA